MARKKSAAKKAREAETKGVDAPKVEASFEPKKKQAKVAPMDSDSEGSDEEEEAAFTINEDYARRFQYNKEREEKVRLELMHKSGAFDDNNNDDESDSTSEEEDDNADLVTEDVDAAIANVIATIRNNPGKLLEKNVKFFDEIKEGEGETTKKEKPMYLKDYHRQNILDGGLTAEGEFPEGEFPEGEKPYAIQQEEDRAKLISEMHADDEDEDDDEDGEDGFLTKRKEQREIEEVELPNPEEDGDGFLDKFVSSKAWMTKDDVPTYDELVEDEEDEFDEKADDFEQEYNFRFQEEDGKEIVSYGRNQDTVRRTADNSRKRQRESKAERKAEEKREREADKARFKKLMVKDVVKKMEALKKHIGEDASRFTAEDFEGDFDDTEWDRRMQQVFNDEFYGDGDSKPTWDDDIDMGGIEVEESDDDEDGDEEETEEKEEEEDEAPALSNRKLKQLEKQQKKKEAKDILEKATAFVEDNVDLAIEKEEARGRKPIREDSEAPKFRYREVSPESYGLTANDILMADDKQLNEYVGLKKLASWRGAEKKAKDQRKYGKKKRLKDWREQVFKKRDAPTDEEIIAALQKQQKGKRRK
ncbi:Protein KRI1 [Yarrowia sp. C11]|nr:Protein KRI1 [Yarrowia sp. E02]KAG5369051.1 Protein KRI1 [Yarrowia sp. C11]